MDEVSILRNPPVTDAELNALFAAAWPAHGPREFQAILHHSLAYLCAMRAGRSSARENLRSVIRPYFAKCVHPHMQRIHVAKFRKDGHSTE